MGQSHDARPNLQDESRSLFREGLVELAAVEIRELLDRGQTDAALALFRRLHPVDQGEVLVNVGEGSQLPLLEGLPPVETADILEDLQPKAAAELSEGIQTDRLARILEQTSPDAAADILQLLPAETLDQCLLAMADAQEVASLLQYRQDSAGGLMTLDYPVVRES